jgi:hypothetical protein
LLHQKTVLVADTDVEINRCSRRRRTVSGLAHAAELNRRWGEDEVEEGASGGEINFVVSRVEDLADRNAQSDKKKRNNSRELHVEVVWYGLNGYCLMVECFLFRSRKRKVVMIGNGKSVKKRREIGVK